MMDADYMRIALGLAEKSNWFVSPNPMVGCVIVKDGEIIGEGFHKEFGSDHAEITALKSCKVDPRGSTVYVNLQPCCHQGKTGACTDALIEAGVSKIVYATKDTNPLVAEKSDQILRDAGIDLVSGVLVDEAIKLNRKFLYWKSSARPWITLKVAATLDGKVAMKSGESKYITSQDARGYVHKLRAEHDAILIGSGTLKADNPNLGLHGVEGKDPFRFILGSNVDLDDSQVFRDDNYAIVASVEEMFQICKDREISSVLVEGGSKIFTSFLKNGYVNELVYFLAHKIIGDNHIAAFGDIGLDMLQDSVKLTPISSRGFENCHCIRFLLKE